MITGRTYDSVQGKTRVKIHLLYSKEDVPVLVEWKWKGADYDTESKFAMRGEFIANLKLYSFIGTPNRLELALRDMMADYGFKHDAYRFVAPIQYRNRAIDDYSTLGDYRLTFEIALKAKQWRLNVITIDLPMIADAADNKTAYGDGLVPVCTRVLSLHKSSANFNLPKTFLVAHFCVLWFVTTFLEAFRPRSA